MLSSVTVSIGVGLLVGLSFIELFSLFCGGVIVPGYIALYLDNPVTVALTLVISALSYLMVKGISKFVFMYGRRQYVAMLIASFVLGVSFNQFIQSNDLPLGNIISPGGEKDHFGVIGYVIPGLIANWFERQGVFVTICTVVISAILVRLVLTALSIF